LADYCEKGSPISYQEDCKKRGRSPDNTFTINGLNESAMLDYYSLYIRGDLPKDECSLAFPETLFQQTLSIKLL